MGGLKETRLALFAGAREGTALVAEELFEGVAPAKPLFYFRGLLAKKMPIIVTNFR
jgi:hypothetical protein